MKYIPINWELISNPANWLIVVLMVTIGAVALSLVAGATKQGA